MKDLYELTRKLAGKKSPASKPIKGKHGNTLTKLEDQLKRWGEYFEDLLNRPPAPGSLVIPEAELMLDSKYRKTQPGRNSKSNPETKERKSSRTGWHSSRNSKSRCKHLNTDVVRDLWEGLGGGNYSLGLERVRSGKVPKKGNLANCNNYRGITMLSVPGKILSQIICKD